MRFFFSMCKSNLEIGSMIYSCHLNITKTFYLHFLSIDSHYQRIFSQLPSMMNHVSYRSISQTSVHYIGQIVLPYLGKGAFRVRKKAEKRKRPPQPQVRKEQKTTILKKRYGVPLSKAKGKARLRHIQFGEC